MLSRAPVFPLYRINMLCLHLQHALYIGESRYPCWTFTPRYSWLVTAWWPKERWNVCSTKACLALVSVWIRERCNVFRARLGGLAASLPLYTAWREPIDARVTPQCVRRKIIQFTRVQLLLCCTVFEFSSRMRWQLLQQTRRKISLGVRVKGLANSVKRRKQMFFV